MFERSKWFLYVSEFKFAAVFRTLPEDARKTESQSSVDAGSEEDFEEGFSKKEPEQESIQDHVAACLEDLQCEEVEEVLQVGDGDFIYKGESSSSLALAEGIQLERPVG